MEQITPQILAQFLGRPGSEEDVADGSQNKQPRDQQHPPAGFPNVTDIAGGDPFIDDVRRQVGQVELSGDLGDHEEQRAQDLPPGHAGFH